MTVYASQWIANPSVNRGMLVKQQNEGGDNLVSFYSSEYALPSRQPKLVLEYTAPGPPTPAGFALQPCTGGCTTWATDTTTPTVTVSAVDPAGADITYRFELRDGSANADRSAGRHRGAAQHSVRIDCGMASPRRVDSGLGELLGEDAVRDQRGDLGLERLAQSFD